MKNLEISEEDRFQDLGVMVRPFIKIIWMLGELGHSFRKKLADKFKIQNSKC